MMKPGDDPFVITVGSSNDEGTMNISDDRVPVFSSRGETRSATIAPEAGCRGPGGSHGLVAFAGKRDRQQLSVLDARVEGDYFRGTGTSMSTATVSGIVALMLTADPSLTPDQVKSRLLESARPIVRYRAQCRRQRDRGCVRGRPLHGLPGREPGNPGRDRTRPPGRRPGLASTSSSRPSSTTRARFLRAESWRRCPIRPRSRLHRCRRFRRSATRGRCSRGSR